MSAGEARTQEMRDREIRTKVKEVISQVAGLDLARIPDDATFEALELDSLSLLEIGIDVDEAFQLGVAEERLGELASISDTVALVLECLDARPVLHAEVA